MQLKNLKNLLQTFFTAPPQILDTPRFIPTFDFGHFSSFFFANMAEVDTFLLLNHEHFSKKIISFIFKEKQTPCVNQYILDQNATSPHLSLAIELLMKSCQLSNLHLLVSAETSPNRGFLLERCFVSSFLTVLCTISTFSF